MARDTRRHALTCSLEILREGGVLSLDSVARQAGLTKPGLMYHFPSKEALMLGIVDHVTETYGRELQKRLGGPPDEASAADRLRVYADWAFGAGFDASDLVAFSDPRLRDQLAQRWTEQLGPWVAVPDDLPAGQQARLHAVRLIADGTWLADATDALPLDDTQRAAVRAVVDQLLEDPR